MGEFKEMKETLAETVKRIRIERNLTQKEVADALGVTAKHISNIENGRTALSLQNLKSFAEYTKLTVDQLLRGETKAYVSNGNELSVVSVRLARDSSLYSGKYIECASDAVEVAQKELATYDREVFAILNLTTKGEVINLNICSIGTLSATMVSPREAFKASILSNASSFIAIHNHPSGDPTPSLDDSKLTERLAYCGRLLGIRMS